jgi:hypothetical protein
MDESKKCKDKLVFDNKNQAKTAASVANYQRGTKLKAYKCPDCGLWHLASDYSSFDDKK